MRFLALALAASLGLSAPARADGALAVGYTADGSVVWGFQYGEDSVEAAEPKALKICLAQRGGSDCTLLRLALYGEGPWVAIALDSNVTKPQRLPFGEYYSVSKEKAATMAIAACEKDGGRHCKIALLAQNKKVITYTIVPGGGGTGYTAPPYDYFAAKRQSERWNCLNGAKFNGATYC